MEKCAKKCFDVFLPSHEAIKLWADQPLNKDHYIVHIVYTLYYCKHKRLWQFSYWLKIKIATILLVELQYLKDSKKGEGKIKIKPFFVDI